MTGPLAGGTALQPAGGTSRRTAALKTGLAALLALATTLIAWRPDWIEAVGLGDPAGGPGMARMGPGQDHGRLAAAAD